MKQRDMAFLQFHDLGCGGYDYDWGKRSLASYCEAIDKAHRDGYRTFRLVRGLWLDDTPLCGGHCRLILRTVTGVLNVPGDF